jgi:hypothetical protein
MKNQAKMQQLNKNATLLFKDQYKNLTNTTTVNKAMNHLIVSNQNFIIILFFNFLIKIYLN